MLIENRFQDVLDQVDSDSCAPGGGSVSALVGALGVCLARMYGHLSINKKRFLELEENVQKEFYDRFQELSEYRNQLSDAADKDCEAYNEVMKAFKMPKITDEEKQLRSKAIQKATYIAIESPYRIMCESLKAMRLCEALVDNGNKNAISDLACGVILLDAAIQGAGFNVEINLSGLNDDERKEWEQKMNDVLHESHELKEKIVKQVKKHLG